MTAIKAFDSTEQSTCYHLPPLPYPFDALEPFLDSDTLRIHHDEHHQAYVDQLNKVIAPYPQLHNLTIEDLLRHLGQVPEEIRLAVRDQGGGHANHQFLWKVIGPPRNTQPQGKLLNALNDEFGGLPVFQEQFTELALNHLGSGWVFLVINPENNKLEIMALSNNDSVLLHKRVGLLICDVWEHAYYLNYQNHRTEYLKAFWNIVDWDVVSTRLDNFYAGKQQL